MNFEVWEYSGNKQGDYPHGEGMQMFIYDQSTFSGHWHNGLKVGTGIYEVHEMIIKVKFKAGKIHKFLEVISNTESLESIELKQPNYDQIGEFYRECSEGSPIFLHYYRNTPLFGGRPSHLKEIIASINPPYNIFANLEKITRLYEFHVESYKYIGNMVQNIPVGKGKFVLSKGFYVKGETKAGYMSGICKIKNSNFSLIFNSDEFPRLSTLRVTSKQLKTDDEILLTQDFYFYNQNSPAKNNPQLLDFLSNSYESLINFLIQYSNIVKINSSIHASINVDLRWDAFEVIMNHKDKNYQFFRELKGKNARKKGENRQSDAFDVRNKKVKFEQDLKAGSHVVKVRFLNQEVYYGEFKGNCKNGLGIFQFNNGSSYRGYFRDNQLHGRGRYQCKDFTLIGIWSFNRLVKTLYIHLG